MLCKKFVDIYNYPNLTFRCGISRK